MVTEPQIRFYLGANSPTGFYSLYNQLMDPAEAEDIMILKGGPGCGKSSLMRRVAGIMEQHNQTVEYIQCSGDPDSLDAIILPSLKTAIVDGTAPHVVEPVCPGAVERYVNLGAFYDREGLRNLRSDITACNNAYKGHYQRAYRCLGASAQILEDTRALLCTQELETKITKRVKGIFRREIKKSGGDGGRSVQRFLGAITWQGVLCNFDTVDSICSRVYELADGFGLSHIMLTHLASGAMAAGYDVISCPSLMAPDRMEHLLIPGLSLAFVTSTPTLPYLGTPYRRIRVDAMADPEIIHRSKARLRFSRKVFNALVEEAVTSLAQAKTLHDELEQFYNPYVDFDGVYRTAEEITTELLGRL